MEKISVIVPCYNEQEVLKEFHTEVTRVLNTLEDIDYEIMFVDDGSKDETLNILKELSASDKKARFISFSRNFGKEAAMYAGLENVKGSLVVIMDADLQHSPSIIPQMLEGINEGYDMCMTRRSKRKGEGLRGVFSSLFYKVLNRISNIEVAEGAQDYCMMRRVVVDAILKMTENNRFTKGIYAWVGFKKKWIETEDIPRQKGVTKWSTFGLFKYALDGLINFSSMPLLATSFFGVIFCLLSLAMIIFVCVKTIFFGEVVQGFPTLICTICLIGGIVMLSMGILGQYLAKTYVEVKNRPIYIVRERNEE
ncbi:MAG: glycosyltransferase [Clostridia bacterium]|nr:glycosyltransferase [Clostridia bacterium]